MSGRDEWRWTDEQGVQRLVRTEELRAALASNVLPPSTLVWRDGMTEWVPAFTVAELVGAARSPESKPPPPAPPSAPPPKPRSQLQTLVGLASPEGERPSVPEVPIVVPHVDQGKTSGITQQPRYDGTSGAPAVEVTIPRAPRVPTADSKPAAASNAPLSRTQGGTKAAERRARTSEIDGLWGSPPAREELTGTDDTLVRPDSKAQPPPNDAKPSANAAREPERAGDGGDAARAASGPIDEVTADTDPDASETLAASEAKGPDTTERPATNRPRPPPVPVRPRPRAATPKPASAAPPRRPPSMRPPGPPPKPLPLLAARPTTTGPAEGTAASGAKKPAPTGPPPKPTRPPPIKSAPPKAEEVKAPTTAGETERAAPAPTAASTAAKAPESLSKTDLAAPAPPSGPPPLVGKLQVPASSLPATAPPVTAEKESIAVGMTTANMPALIDPTASSWLMQTTTSGASSAAGPAGVAQPAPEKKDFTTTAVLATAATARASERPPPLAGAAPSEPPASAAATSADRPPTSPSERPPAMPSDRPAASPSERPPAMPSDRPPALPSDRPPAFGIDPALLRPSQRPPGALPALRDMVRPEHLSQPVAVPFSSLLGAAGTLIVMVVSAFLVGRCSIVADASAPNRAMPSLGLLPLIARAAIPPLPKPCWVARQPVMWAPMASKNIPFELVATDKGTLAVGYAKSEREAVGIEVEPASGQVTQRFASGEVDGQVDRISPSPAGDTFHVSAGRTAMRPVVHVPGPSPFVIGMAKDEIVAADSPAAQPSTLWAAPSSDPNTLRAQVVPDRGTLVIVRREGGIYGGWIGPDRKPVGSLVRVTGSGGAVGKPMTGQNRKQVAVVFADRPGPGAKWEIRVGTAPVGKVPDSTVVIPLPKGGPGGDAFAPDIAGLSDGRWLLVWTEGPPGSRAIRALTLDADLTPIGDPIALSPPAGNFGQGALGVVGDYAATVFLQKGATTYELWGAVLQCG